MADTTLDDFFAKKDKNKRKTKTKSEVVSDESRNIASGTKPPKEQNKKKDKDEVNAAGGLINVAPVDKQEDEEWADFEEAKEVDYSGLRIRTLHMSNDDQDKDGGDGDSSGDDDDENKDRRDGLSGPWNKSGTQMPSAQPAVQQETASVESTPKAPTKYVPPAQRQAALSSSSSSKVTSSRKKEAPNVNSEEDFPTLGGGPGSKSTVSQQYSRSLSSDLVDNPNKRGGIGLSLGNKFSALQD